AKFSGPNSGLYKSTDGGEHWRKLTEGLPTADEGLGRIGVAIAPSNSNLMFAVVDASENAGIYKSVDAGESWTFLHGDHRLWGRGGDFAEIKVHPKDPDRLYVGNIASYTSADGGKTWMALKGAPGGDDYHRIWINPINPDIMLFVADQGAVVTVNAGRTWSSWYNQPTTQLYHVSTDNAFPYWVYGGQQESGAIGIASRGNGGQISFREFMGAGADEYAYIAADPKDPDILYGGRVMRFDKKTGQSQNIAPESVRSGKYRFVRTMPLMFHPADDRMLLFATNVLWKTMNGGQDWEVISPDLTYEQPEVPASVGHYKTEALETMARRGVIYAVGPSPLDVNTIWAGTDDGRMHITTNGGQDWTEVTPPAMTSWDKVSQIDASHFDKGTAYIAINAIRKDDMTPYVYRTKDSGKSWDLITNGMNPSGSVNVVREDPKKQGLLYAGTEREVYFSIDEGENWQSLRNNMPASSMRDLVIHEDDLVVGTHGRSIWILDNIAPLREMQEAQSASAFLFQPPRATRVRDNMFSDTPLPPEEPTGENPPDGAILDYQLNEDASLVTLEILDSDGEVIRTYRSDSPAENIDTTTLPHPTYWMRPEQKLGASIGHHRFIWNLRHEPPRGARRQFSIAAVYKNTPSGPFGPFVLPGQYIVRLTVDGQATEKALTVRMDPRVKTSTADLKKQSEMSMRCYDAYHELQTIREAIDQMSNASNAIKALRGNGAPGNPDTMYGSIRESPIDQETVAGLQHKFLFVLNLLQGADATIPKQTIEAVDILEDALDGVKSRWDTLK
ncbi:MAG: glycoside hydrolase, partial [Bacteroidetes bacterium]